MKYTHLYCPIIILSLLSFFITSMSLGSSNRENVTTHYGEGESFTVYLPTIQTGKKELEMIKVPAGSFQMGSPANEAGREENEGPVRTVTISTDFYMGKYEITQAQWLALMDENPSTEVGGNLPVNKVSWDDCQEFIQRLNLYSNQTEFRLPTEAEMEYAMRGGTSGVSFLGDQHNRETMMDYAWFRDNSEGYMQEVGKLKPNPYGLYDVFGNVWEWCYDWYAPQYPSVNETDPTGPKTGDEKVFRGVSWMGKFDYMRSADRGKFTPDNQRNTGGFRLVWSKTKIEKSN
jgi:formylglycine-generating enzyme required for sulfatase activity